jgi:hypothetical protein
MLFEKFPEKFKIRQVVSQRSRVCFVREMVAIYYLRPK